jgi:hypothetical protein
MIEDQEIKLDRVCYAWSYDGQKKSPQECWQWTDADRHMTPSTVIQGRLNRQFIDEQAADVVATLDRAEIDRFYDILKAMGATDEQLVAIFGDDPDRLPRQMKNPMKRVAAKIPPAAHTPFNSPPVRDWFFAELSRDPRRFTPLPLEVSVFGCDPFEPQDFDDFLKRHHVVPRRIDENSEVVVLGRKDWTRAEIDRLIDLRVGQILRIYSQEMFLVFMTLGLDPFDGTSVVMEAFKTGHPGLEFVSRGWSGWVTTFVREDRRNSSARRSLETELVDESPLHVLGYRVGRTGEDTVTRRRILRRAFTGELPKVDTIEYMESWGKPGSPKRLKKIADNIASYSGGMRNRPNPSEEAIEDWESDLEWLREEFYHGHFTFHWPGMYV